MVLTRRRFAGIHEEMLVSGIGGKAFREVNG